MLRILTSLPILVVVVVGALMLGGAPTAAIQDTPDEKILRIQWGAVPGTVDPQRIAYVNDVAVAGLGWEGLTRIDDQMSTVPAAAEYSLLGKQVVQLLI